ncbi:neurotrimin [Lingula anatina]|uniref:Neurotrimin n=1 Tax=Lingula anatina TaxID=7574 RepID=A0A1S3HUI6_LINAN|nr:neurotrimin [Lingula anatina]|eukprot:XP_013389206.1 neurotrimin [Lingula anatina]
MCVFVFKDYIPGLFQVNQTIKMWEQALCIIMLIGTSSGAGCGSNSGQSGSQTKITQEIIPEVVAIAGTARLTCVVSQLQSNVIHWYHEDRHLYAGDQEVIFDHEEQRYEIEITTDPENQNTLSTLVINQLEQSDSGQYICKVTIQGTNPSLYPCKVGLLTIPVRPYIIHAPASVEVERGKDVNLTCTAAGTPTPVVTWTRLNGSPLPLPGEVYSLSNTTLSLRNVTRDAGGSYRCTANNDVNQPAEATVKLVVAFKPTGKASFKERYQAPGSFEVTLECIISGEPLPEFAWYGVSADGYRQKLHTDNDYSIEVVSGHGYPNMDVSDSFLYLRIFDVESTDYGRYECEGYNKYGRTTSTVMLLESDECQGPACPNLGPSIRSGCEINLPSAISIILVLTAAVCLVRYE